MRKKEEKAARAAAAEAAAAAALVEKARAKEEKRLERQRLRDEAKARRKASLPPWIGIWSYLRTYFRLATYLWCASPKQ